MVNVTRTTDEILTDWRSVAAIIGFAGILGTAAAAMVVVTLVRQFRTYESLTQALAERAEAVLAREQAEGLLHQSQKLEAVGKLTTGIAHDFNNLLTTMIGNLEFLKHETKEPTTERRVQAIQKAVDRAASLTEQLLAFSRKQRLLPEAVDLNELIGNMTDMLGSSLGDSIRIELALSSDLWRALVDRVQIELVLLNMAINARDAMEAGGVLTIATDNVSAGVPALAGDPPQGDYVLITISDTGTGMTEDVLERAFDPFFTTKPPGRGTGLGLSQAYGTVHQLGGTIRIDTKLGIGTTVRIYLPRVDAAAAEQPSPPAHAAVPLDHRPIRVLVVDDDAGVRDVTAEMLQVLDFMVTEAESGKEALDLLAADASIDVMVVDFAMPELNGTEVASYARRIRPDLPVVFVTGFADVDSLAGEDWVLQKPFHQDELAAKIGLALAEGSRRALNAEPLS